MGSQGPGKIWKLQFGNYAVISRLFQNCQNETLANLHEAIAHEPSAQVPEGTVIRQMRRGYRLKDRLLRPSSVVVSSGAPA